MAQLLRIPEKQDEQIDMAVMGRLQDELGLVRCREVVADACFEIIEKLTRFEMASATRDVPDAIALAEEISAICFGIGLPLLERAATGAAEALAAGADATAAAATTQRVIRMGEAAIDALLADRPA